MRSGLIEPYGRWLAAAGLSLALAAGSVPTAHAQTPAVAFDQPAFDLLPDRIKGTKQVRNVVNAPIVPWVALSSDGKMTGPVADLTDAIATVLGIRFASSVSTQANTILDIKSNRADLSFGSMSDTPELEKEGTFLVYVVSPRAVMVKKSSRRFPDLASLCGISIALQGTSSSQAIVKAVSSQYCEAAGKPAVKIKDFPSVAATTLAVQSGQADAILLTLPQVKDIASAAPNLFEVVLDKAPNGLPPIPGALFFPQNSDLIPAFQKAFDDLIKSGTYMAILKKYGLEDSAVTTTVVNMATTQPQRLDAVPPLTALK